MPTCRDGRVLAALPECAGVDIRRRELGDTKKTRRYSDKVLSAPINYGPGLKMLGWVQRHPLYPDLLYPDRCRNTCARCFRAADQCLGHPAFSAFGPVTVTKAEVRAWADDWPLDAVTPAEAKAMAVMLFGAEAPQCRQFAGKMILKAIDHALTTDADRLRSTMAGPPSDFVPSQHLQDIWDAFRRLQVRQLSPVLA